jgi:hypothetical protein
MTLTGSERAGRFRVEADMLEPLAAAAPALARNPLVFFEVPSSAGVPDIVLLEIDKAAVAGRSGAAPLVEAIDIRLMLAVACGRTPTKHFRGIDELSILAGVGSAHLRRTVLPRLVEDGHLLADGDCWAPRYRFRSLAKRIVTVEAKLRDWRGAIAQASRHTAAADAAWVALDVRAVAPAVKNAEWFSTYGVGLLAVSTSGSVERLIQPAGRSPRKHERELLAERTFALHLSGRASGPMPRVFGNVLLASTGADPRLVGAAVG